jgi:hypothetical protein
MGADPWGVCLSRWCQCRAAGYNLDKISGNLYAIPFARNSNALGTHVVRTTIYRSEAKRARDSRVED